MALGGRANGPGDRVDPRVAEAAAQWLVELGAGDARERDRARAGFDAWKQADPRHAAAAARMERLLDSLRPLQDEHAPAACAALRAGDDTGAAARGRQGRRVAAGALGALGALAVALSVWVGVRDEWPQARLADLRTDPGEWRSQSLPDGSRLTLAGGAAVDLHFDGRQRSVRLLRGDILVDVAKDPQRPFIVTTRDGEVRALGTRFVVRREDRSTRLAMIESATAVRSAAQLAQPPAEAATPTVVRAGEEVRIDARGVTPLAPMDAQGLQALEAQWRQRQWLVLDRPLSEVLDELARHRRGHLAYDAQALAGLRVSALLPLDDTDRALDLLQASFPQLRVRAFTPLWVSVDASR